MLVHSELFNRQEQASLQPMKRESEVVGEVLPAQSWPEIDRHSGAGYLLTLRFQ